MPKNDPDREPVFLTGTETGALILSLFFVGVSFGGSSPLVSALLEARGFSEYFTGAVVAMLSLGLATFSPVAGRLVDRFGPRPISVLGIVLQGIGFAGLGLALARDERWLFAARFWLGVSAALTFVASEFALLKGTRSAYRARVMAAYGAAFGTGFMLGVFLSDRIFEGFGLASFPLLTGVAVSIAPLAYWGLSGLGSELSPDVRNRAREMGAPLPWQGIRIALYGAVVYAVLDIAMTGTYPVEGQRLGLSRSVSLTVVAWMAFGTVFVQPVAGWLADRFGNRRLFVVLSLTGVAASAGAGYLSAHALPGTILPVIFCFTIVGCAAGGIFPVSLALLGERTPAPLLSRANAAYSAVFGYASLLAPLVAASFIDVMERWELLGWAVPSLALLTFAFGLPLAWADRAREATEPDVVHDHDAAASAIETEADRG